MDLKEEIQRQLEIFKAHMNMAFKYEGKTRTINTAELEEHSGLLHRNGQIVRIARVDIKINGELVQHVVLEAPQIVPEESLFNDCRRKILDSIALAGLDAQNHAVLKRREFEKHGLQLKINFDEEIS